MHRTEVLDSMKYELEINYDELLRALYGCSLLTAEVPHGLRSQTP